MAIFKKVYFGVHTNKILWTSPPIREYWIVIRSPQIGGSRQYANLRISIRQHPDQKIVLKKLIHKFCEEIFE